MVPFHQGEMSTTSYAPVPATSSTLTFCCSWTVGMAVMFALAPVTCSYSALTFSVTPASVPAGTATLIETPLNWSFAAGPALDAAGVALVAPAGAVVGAAVVPEPVAAAGLVAAAPCAAGVAG